MFPLTRLLSLARPINHFHFRMASAAATGSRRLEGKVAVVTASTEGIGYAIAKRLGEEGAHVVISSRKQANVDKALKSLKEANLSVSGLVCHVGKESDRAKLIEMAVKENGGLDILVSNAAANPFFGKILDCDDKSWDKIFEINVKSAFLLVKESVPHMVSRGGGSVVLVSSIAGYMPFELLGPYSVSKTALLGLTKALTPQLTEMNIRVNCVAPGLIKTNFSAALFATEESTKLALSQIPMKRAGTPDEIAGIVSFLASDDASYITGENMLVAGGSPSKL
ncbi:dehydrogenase/reductase SDR family member 4-like [Lytechinus pictus]|uniref:dehydrogenase/reductase SDR family member 4-like n=1 Tax=Lytechinus pictus TaxID=7653 RepID=UPI0030BA05E8